MAILALGVSIPLQNAAGENSSPSKHAVKLGDFLAGMHAQQMRDSKAAIRFFRSNMASNPDNIDIQNRIFSILVFDGKIKKSLPLAEKLIKSKYADVNLPLLVLALQDIRAGRHVNAIKVLDSLPKKGINEFSVPILKAWSLAAGKKYDEALRTLENRMNNPGVTALFAPQAGLIAELAGKSRESEKYFKNSLKQFRQIGANLTRLLGSYYERNAQPVEAEALYRNYLKANPGSTVFNQSLSRLTAKKFTSPKLVPNRSGVAEALFSLSRSIQPQNPYQAIVFSRLAIFVDPEFNFAKLRLADELTRSGNMNNALTIYKSISKDPVYGWTARLRVARTYNFLEKVDDAAKILETMAKEKKNRIDALVTLGNIYRNHLRYREATNAFEKAKKRVKKWEVHHWQLLYGNAASLERLNKWPAAEKDFLKALELNPNEPTVLNYLGYSWVEKGKNLARARKMIENAVKQRPRAAYIVDSLGWVQYRMGDLKGAVKNLERAVLLTPADPTINDHLGDIYWKVGRKLEARYQWQRALSLEPDKDQIPLIKKKIKSGLPNI